MSSGAATRFHPEDMQLLAWKFLDGCASQAEQQQLAGCLSEDQAARSIYLQCVQMHVDLLTHFGGLKLPNIAERATAQAKAKPAMPLPLSVVSPLPLMNMPSPF